MKFNKKAISPVVATALLLVVAVVAVVGFQTWFTTYQSSQFVSVEQKADAGGAISVERVGTNGKVLIKNAGSAAVTLSSLDVTQGAVSCSLNVTASDALANAVTTFNNDTACPLVAGNPADIVVVTDTGVASVEMMVR